MPKRKGHQLIRKIRSLRQQLSSFDRSLRRLASMVSQLDGRIERRRKPRAGSRKPLSAKDRASLVLKIREAKGVRKTIRRARKLATS